MTPLKRFQQATVDAAVSALTDRRRRVRRFLVADEVGLGKTVIAQHVIARLMADRRTPLTVFYVCSSLSIAAQNRRKLLQVLPEPERRTAFCHVDRLTLLPASDRPVHARLHLYALTPDTSVPIRQGRRRDGRQEERALIQALVEETFPDLISQMAWGPGFFRRNAQLHWKELLTAKRQQVRGRGLRDAFQSAVRKSFELSSGQWLVTRLRSIRDELEIVARFRAALAIQALSDLSPDLVIFDEFQRFRDLVDDQFDEAASRIVSALRGEAGYSALLMLSATPYSLLTSRADDASGDAHHQQLLDLVAFLYGGGEAGRTRAGACRDAFGAIESGLFRGDIDRARLSQAVRDAEAVLRPVMARTERLMHPLGRETGSTLNTKAPLLAVDLQSFRCFSDSLQAVDRPFAPVYWSSIPMPLQTMGSRYETWKRARHGSQALPKVVDLDLRSRFRLAGPWPHPKLRALMQLQKPETLALPWVPPTLPWWDLAGPWRHAEASRGKLLVFSRFRAVPAAVSGALSYELERKYLRSKPFDYSDIPKRRMLQATGERMPLLGAFHPCMLIATHVDPLQARSPVRKTIRSSVREQLDRLLREHLRIEIRNTTSRPRPVWQLIAGIEAQAGCFDASIQAWRALHERIGRSSKAAADETDAGDAAAQGGLARLLERWQQARQPITAITRAELDELVTHALSAPGVLLGRALFRHWPLAAEQGNLDAVLGASWQGLRSYLDQRWFAALLGGSERNYLRQLQSACVDGNLESVLDEWFWLLVTTQGSSGRELCDEFSAATRIRGSEVVLHDGARRAQQVRLRAHAALPFSDVRQRQVDGDEEASPLRNDELRRAFNSPFHPHVLTTTSVGQEGLDFHAWCRTVVHWDLAPNAVDLEQREGRVQRFAGLSVRRRIADRLGEPCVRATEFGASPWRTLAAQAEATLADASGLAPWWVCEGADIERCVLDVPTSEQRARLEILQAQRGLYRLVLGQPHQEDLMAMLRQRQRAGSVVDANLVPVLSPYFAGLRDAVERHENQPLP